MWLIPIQKFEVKEQQKMHCCFWLKRDEEINVLNVHTFIKMQNAFDESYSPPLFVNRAKHKTQETDKK